MGENINQISDKGPEYMKNSYNSRIKRQIAQLKIGKVFEDISLKKIYI